jgi:hypothetical protein
MGRPPIGRKAMSAAERMRRHRAKLRADKPLTVTMTKAEVAEIYAGLQALQEKRAAGALNRGNITEFSLTLYDLLCAYAQTTNRRTRRKK